MEADAGSTRLYIVEGAYLTGLKEMNKKGARIVIDGTDTPEHSWQNIFYIADEPPETEDGFYMADYVAAPEGHVSEVRFNRIYFKEFDL